ncbi:MAG: DNA-deoxyinosine glycosylase [Alphaproteobacteria bacterium]|nr:DNA-deoxyinosine glycosylase [Alphaproteobacteria bacterium]
MPKCKSFKPVSSPNACVLILGSLPGAESLRQKQYYAKPQNAFWRIMGKLIGALPEMPYEERLERLVSRRIALWDVCAAANREGSLDSNIQNAVANDFGRFFRVHPRIETIFFNGRPAEKLFLRLVPVEAPLPSAVLPSTSPAYAGMPFEEKLSRWQEGLAPFLAKP